MDRKSFFGAIDIGIGDQILKGFDELLYCFAPVVKREGGEWGGDKEKEKEEEMSKEVEDVVRKN